MGWSSSKAHSKHRASPWVQSQSQGNGIPKELCVLPCLPAPVGSRRHWKHSSAPSPKRSTGFCSLLLLIYAMALWNFPKADGRFSSFRQESGPWRLIYLGALLACENRPKAERGGTPYCKCIHATQTQLMPDVQMLTLLIWSLSYCMEDLQMPPPLPHKQANYSGKRGNKQSCKSILKIKTKTFK